MEVVVAGAIFSVVAGSLFIVLGAAARSKMIVINRSADTETGRQTLEWMSERLRNAGLNVLPSAQAEPRCQDMIVAQDATLRPQPDSIYVSGEILNSDTAPGNEVITLGFRLGTGVDSGRVIQDIGSCAGAWVPGSAIVSDPRVTVTELSFRYFRRSGDEVIVPTSDIEAIRSIGIVAITLKALAAEGAFSAAEQDAQVPEQTFTRLVMLRNPRPDTNLWLSPTETDEAP